MYKPNLARKSPEDPDSGGFGKHSCRSIHRDVNLCLTHHCTASAVMRLQVSLHRISAVKLISLHVFCSTTTCTSCRNRQVHAQPPELTSRHRSGLLVTDLVKMSAFLGCVYPRPQGLDESR